ncbi:unnamed protein product, partial [marine sediment metagenome]
MIVSVTDQNGHIYLAEKWSIKLTVMSALDDNTGRINPIEQ